MVALATLVLTGVDDYGEDSHLEDGDFFRGFVEEELVGEAAGLIGLDGAGQLVEACDDLFMQQGHLAFASLLDFVLTLRFCHSRAGTYLIGLAWDELDGRGNVEERVWIHFCCSILILR